MPTAVVVEPDGGEVSEAECAALDAVPKSTRLDCVTTAPPMTHIFVLFHIFVFLFFLLWFFVCQELFRIVFCKSLSTR